MSVVKALCVRIGWGAEREREKNSDREKREREREREKVVSIHRLSLPATHKS